MIDEPQDVPEEQTAPPPGDAAAAAPRDAASASPADAAADERARREEMEAPPAVDPELPEERLDDAAPGEEASEEVFAEEQAQQEAEEGTEPVAEEEAEDEIEPAEEAAAGEEDAAEEDEKEWYILKVQSNRENSICDGLRRRVKVAGLEEYFGDIIVPTEEVREFKDGKARIVKRKLYPGYIVVHMVINDDTWFLVRETPGIGDFTGAGGKPTPMLSHEVEKILRLAGKLERPEKTGPRPLIPYKVGDKVRIEEGNFQNFEGEVSAIDEANGRVTIMIQIFNRTTPVELEHWQVKAL